MSRRRLPSPRALILPRLMAPRLMAPRLTAWGLCALLAGSSAVWALNVTVGPQSGDVTGSDSLALQAAVDRVAKDGGGTVFVRSGTYVMLDALQLRAGVRVAGVGAPPVLLNSPSVSLPLVEDAGCGTDRLVVADSTGLAAGMGVAVMDDTHAAAWYVGCRSIVAVEGNELVLDEPLDLDYLIARHARVSAAHAVVSARRAKNARLENLILDGNRGTNVPLDGCRAAGVYLWRCEGGAITDCVARNFDGDGISLQGSNGVTVANTQAYRNAGAGILADTGCRGLEITACQVHDNAQVGIFLGWRVSGAKLTDNQVSGNGLDGLSLGHQCNDNTLMGNQITRNGRHGIMLRPELPVHAALRTVLQDNIIRDNGQDQAGDGIHLCGSHRDVTISGNTIEDTVQDGKVTQRNGIVLEAGVDGVKTRGNVIRGHSGERVVDQSGGTRNSLQY